MHKIKTEYRTLGGQNATKEIICTLCIRNDDDTGIGLVDKKKVMILAILQPEKSMYTIGMITDTGGVMMNPSTNLHGRLERLKINMVYKVKVKYLESTKDADYVPNIETFVEEDLDLIIGVGYKLQMQ